MRLDTYQYIELTLEDLSKEDIPKLEKIAKQFNAKYPINESKKGWYGNK